MGNWQDSTCSALAIEKVSPSEIRLSLNWSSFPIKQLWCIKILQDNEISWKVITHIKDSLSIDKIHIEVFLSESYAQWINSYQIGKFPKEFSQWLDIPIRSKDVKLIGVCPTHMKIPTVLFDFPKNLEAMPFIQNTDKATSARLLQAQIEPKKKFISGEQVCFIGTIKIIDDKKKLRIFLEKEREKKYKFQMVQAGSLKLSIDKGKVKIHYKNTEITRDNGLHVSLYSEGKWYHSYNGIWQIKKIDKKKMENKVIWGGNFGLVWGIEIQRDTIVNDIKIEIYKKIALLGKQVLLDLSSRYTNWKTPCEYGYFTKGEYINGLNPVRLKESRLKMLQVDTSKDKILPKVTFDFSHLKSIWLASIYKKLMSNDIEKITLQATELTSAKDKFIPLGKHHLFSGKIFIGKQVSLKERMSPLLGEIEHDNLKLILDEGRGRIFWQGKELTKGLGIYTSIRSRGIWHDSRQAIWELKKNQKHKLIARGFWAYLPIFQDWEVQLLNSKTIFWRVKMGFLEKTDFEIAQVNVMVSDKYKNWKVTNRAQGKFSDEFTDNYDILPYRAWSDEAIYGQMTLETLPPLPSVMFDCSQTSDSQAIIANSDSLFKARILQCQKVIKIQNNKAYVSFCVKINLGNN